QLCVAGYRGAPDPGTPYSANPRNRSSASPSYRFATPGARPMAGSTIAVYGAIAANVAIAVTKFAVGAITGSSAMIAEGIHSAVDTGNGALLLVGLRLSEREATPEFPFGHGKEL